MIRQLEENDFSSAMRIVRAATTAMNDAGIAQWDDIYPNTEKISGDIAAGSLFGYDRSENLVGIIALNEIGSPEYDRIQWNDTGGKPLFVHRLCVHPEAQGSGVAKQLMRFAESFAVESGFTSIRLDAFIQNPVAVGLYDSLGYERLGEVTFRKGRFYCYERILR